MSFSIKGKTAIVTGAANGIGLAISRHFIEQGANVMMADKDEEHLKQEMMSMSTEDGNAKCFTCDLREKLSHTNLLSATIDVFDKVDILVNGSRQVTAMDPIDYNDDNVVTMLDQNLMSSLRLTQLISERMIKQTKETGIAGSILNLSSIASLRTRPGLMGYSISSAALDQMTRTMAVALAPYNIRVNAISFGSVMSKSLENSLKKDSNLRDEIVKNTPLGRIAPAIEIAQAAQFLCSEASNFITGEVMTIDGGRSLLDPVKIGAH